MTKKELARRLENHELWITGGAEELRADLSRANLINADLSGQNLSCANLAEANLQFTVWANAKLAEANLQGASLYGACLINCSLLRADLTGADLKCAKLSGADLWGAKGIIAIAGLDYPLYLRRGLRDKPAMVLAGCRWFTVEKARQHWSPSNHRWCVELEHFELMRAKLDAALLIAKAQGWRV